MQIKVVGLPNPKSRQTLLNAQAAASEFENRMSVRWISDISRIIAMGKIVTPSLIVNGRAKISGRIPSVYEIKSSIEQELKKERSKAEVAA